MQATNQVWSRAQTRPTRTRRRQSRLTKEHRVNDRIQPKHQANSMATTGQVIQAVVFMAMAVGKQIIKNINIFKIKISITSVQYIYKLTDCGNRISS